MTEERVPEDEAPQGIPAEPESTDDAVDSDAAIPDEPADEGETQEDGEAPA